MKCLTDEQLLTATRDRDRNSDVSRHLEDCPACRERIKLMQHLSNTIRQTHERLEEEHNSAKQHLLSRLQKNSPSESFAKDNSTTGHRVTNLLMNRRLLLGAAGLACAAVSVSLVLMLFADGSVSAMEQTATAVRNAASYIIDGEFEIMDRKMRFRFYRSGTGFRMEQLEEDRVVNSQVIFKDKLGLRLDHKTESYQQLKPRPGHQSPLMMLEKLGDFKGKADSDLGEKTIDGKKTQGFAIGIRRIDPDAQPGMVELWINAKTSLPLQMAIKSEEMGTMRFSKFQWNVKISADLFNTVPPQTYADKTPTPPQADVLVKNITAGLKTYADLSDGQYPHVKMVYGDVILGEMMKNIGIQNHRPTPGQLRSKQYSRILMTSRGFGYMNMLQRESTEATYHGKTVGSKDKNKVLFRWNLLDGDYQVIYGDLRSEKVTPARLRELETK